MILANKVFPEWLCLHTQVFLLREERNLLETSSQNSLGRPPLPNDVAISLEDYTLSWAKNASAITLDSVNLDVHQVRFLFPAIFCSVGCIDQNDGTDSP